jgi:hypothetical protein
VTSFEVENEKSDISLGWSNINKPFISSSFLSRVLGVVSLLTNKNITTAIKTKIKIKLSLILLDFIK